MGLKWLVVRTLEHQRVEMQREEAVMRSLREEVFTCQRFAEEAREEKLQGKGALDEAKARAQRCLGAFRAPFLES